MKISCLIAAYRAGPYIARALESLRAQEHRDWELIVVEDGSRDQTQELVETFARSVRQRVHYENFGQNRGVASARTRLLERAEGEAAAFLDADDWWTPRHLSAAANQIGGGADVVVARVQVFDLASGKPLETYVPAGDLWRDPRGTLLARSAVMTSSAVTLRLGLARVVGPFDPSFRIGEDRDYWLRCAAQGARFADSGELTCFYAKHAQSTMAKTLLWAEQEVAFHRKHADDPALPERVRRRTLVQSLVNYGLVSRGSDPERSLDALRQACALQPFSPAIWVQTAVSAWRARQRRRVS